MKRQKGFTLVEMLVVTAIIALIALGASMSISQVFKVSKQNNDMSTAIRQAQNVGYWVSHDALMASTIVPEPSADVKISMGWSTWGTANDYVYDVRYQWLESGEVRRQLLVYDENGVEIPGLNRTLTIADNIVQLDLTDVPGNWKLTVEARSGSQSVIREYVVNPRLNY